MHLAVFMFIFSASCQSKFQWNELNEVQNPDFDNE